MPAFWGFPVLYLGTFDKPFASGLKSGFGICNHKEWISNMLHAKGHQDFGSSNFVQALLEDIVDTEDYGIYVSGLRTHYESKAALVQEVLEAEGLTHKGWRWENPSGGLYFWLEGPKELDTSIGSDFVKPALPVRYSTCREIYVLQADSLGIACVSASESFWEIGLKKLCAGLLAPRKRSQNRSAGFSFAERMRLAFASTKPPLDHRRCRYRVA